MSLILGVIHARGGSRRIPLKNIKKLGGRPLISYIIESALSSRQLDRVIVSTDHEEIMRISREWGAEVPFRRPPHLAEDVPSECVTQHAVNFVEKEMGEEVSIVVTLQPTAPFCRAEDIDHCIEDLREREELDSVISVCEIKERPEWMYSINEEGLGQNLMGEILRGEKGVSQNLPPLYIPNGAVYATRRNALFEKESLLGEKIGLYVMPRIRSIDIDEPLDWLIAEKVLEYLAQKEDKRSD